MLYVVLTMARSRSSLTMQILHRHGIWASPGKPPDAWNATHYYESRALKRLINSRRENVYQTLRVDEGGPDFPAAFWETMRGLGYEDGPCAVKVDALAWRFFERMDPCYVTLWRDVEGIMSSIQRTPFMRKRMFSDARWREIIAAHRVEMDLVESIRVDTDRMVRLEDSGIENVIRDAGLTFDPDIVRDAVT